jgi:hypothetical protein
MQTPQGEPTTPTPYPDGLIIHHADGTSTYPDAYTGVRPVEVPDAWYHSFGFYYRPEDEYSLEYWEWYGPEMFDSELAQYALFLLCVVFVFGGASLAVIYWLRRGLLRSVASLAAWSGLLLAALFIVTIAEYEGDSEFALAIPPIAGLLLFLARPARSLLRALLRYSSLTSLVVFPEIILGALDPEYYGISRFELIAALSWAALAPLALRFEAGPVAPGEMILRNRFLVAAGFPPIAVWFSETHVEWTVMSMIHLVVAALGLAAWGAILLRNSDPPQRGVVVT